MADILKPRFSALDSKAFVKQSAVESFQKAIALRATDLGGSIFDSFQLEEKFIRMLVGPTTKLPAIIGKNGYNGHLMVFKEGEDIVIKEVDRCQRHLRGVKPGKGESGMAVDGGLGIDASNPLEVADMKGVDGHESAGIRSVNVALPKLRIEAFQEGDLLGGKLSGDDDISTANLGDRTGVLNEEEGQAEGCPPIPADTDTQGTA